MTAVQRLLSVLLVLLLAGIAVVLVAGRPSSRAAAPAFAGPTLPPGLRAADFALSDSSGHVIRLSRYRGRVVVLTFIHSLCHDTCPFMVEQIKGALDGLPGAGRGVPVVGISVAPGEDTRARRASFLRRHRMLGRMSFLSGPVPVLRKVWREYAIQPVAGPVDHSTFVLLVDRRGIERVGFPADELTPETLRHDIRVLEREPA